MKKNNGENLDLLLLTFYLILRTEYIMLQYYILITSYLKVEKMLCIEYL